MSDFLHSFSGIAAAIIGVAILAVLLSKKTQADTVITSAGKSFSTILSTALSPLTGA